MKETMTSGEPIRFRYFLSSYPKATRESLSVWKKVPRSMFWLFVVQTLVMFGMAVTQVINQIYAVDVLGISLDRWWMVFIPLLLTMVIASIPIGKTVDKYGRKTPLILGLCIFGAAILIFAYGNFYAVMGSMVLFGIAQLLVMSAVMALATDLVDPMNRGKVVGFRNFVGYIFMGLGMLLGNFFFLLGKSLNFPQLPFYIALALILPTLLIVLFLVHEPKERVGMVQKEGIPEDS